MLVLPPELRTQALASLGAPAWPAPRPRVTEPAPPERESPKMRSVGALLATRLVQLGLIFAAVTIVTVALSLVARALR